MSSSRSAVRRPPEPVRLSTAEIAPPARRVQRLGRVRLPLTLGHRPWATAYRMPNGRTIWCVRLWQNGRVVRAVVPTATVRSYARRSGLLRLLAEIDALAGPEAVECPSSG
jgi:hypothetical protein